ncbi:MAG: cytochrome c3 family protein, partial [Candidatus Zixiibacteriota bacterium]
MVKSRRFPEVSIVVGIALAVIILSTPGSMAVKKCYDCHKKEKAEFTSRKYQHQPSKDENCEACHKRHGFAQQLILQEITNDLCYSCHSDLREHYSSGFVHFPVSDGKCWDCHNPHSSDKKGLLRSGPEGADDPGLCLLCHKKDLEPFLEATFAHEPFAQLNCLRCHDPHNSPQDALLVDDPFTLCGSCHDKDDEKTRQAHEDMHIEGLVCNNCHSGHASDAEGLLSTKTHLP